MTPYMTAKQASKNKIYDNFFIVDKVQSSLYLNIDTCIQSSKRVNEDKDAATKSKIKSLAGIRYS